MLTNETTDTKITRQNESTAHILIIGQGDIGLGVTNHLANYLYKHLDQNLDKHASQDMTVTGLARGDRNQYDLDAKADYIQADALQLTAEQISTFTHIAIIVTPDNYDAENYKHTYLGIAQHISELKEDLPNLKRVVFISSTGVYGQDAGEWIDVTVTPESPKREASKYILQAEQALQKAYGDKAVIIRPSGIYGQDRQMRIRKAKETDKAPMSYAWTNRIMDTDLVTIISKVLTLDDNLIEPVYLATDYDPVTSYRLTKWLSEQLGASQPELDKNSSVSGKRLHSNIPRDWLTYPDWQAGYTHILSQID